MEEWQKEIIVIHSKKSIPPMDFIIIRKGLISMAIFDQEYVNTLLEMRTKEEYHKERFKKKYNFVPDKDSKDHKQGTITVNGEKYRVKMGAESTSTTSKKDDTDTDTINLDNNFFKFKGSHQNERMDAILQHEIGHRKFHGTDPDDKHTDPKNRSQKFFRTDISKKVKHTTEHDINDDKQVYDAARKIFQDYPNHYRSMINQSSPEKVREEIYKKYKEDEYLKNSSKEDQKRRDDDYEKAKKYEKKNNKHLIPEEFEADRYSANRTSERALKNALRNTIKLNKSGASDELNREAREDYAQRTKALKDKDLRNAKTYK